jgi:putative flavoprotein involved in K+ transport
MPDVSVAVIGAGASGLSSVAALQRRGIDVVALEQDAEVGATWARRYDRLHLHTLRGYSGLAHYPVPRSAAKYLSRDDYVAYLKSYVTQLNLRVVTNFSVKRVRLVSHGPALWQVEGADGSWRARAVVLATGQYRNPVVPEWPGLREYRGDFSHSVTYKNPSPYVGKRVLVVGIGNTGAEIAADLIEHGAAFVAISIRTPPAIVPRDPLGNPVQRTSMLMSRLPPRLADGFAKMTARLIFGDLTRFGMPKAEFRPYSLGRVPVIDVGFVSVLKRGLVAIRPALARLTATEAVYADGLSEPFDAIIAATGFTTGLDALLEDSKVLNESNEPIGLAGEPTALPGLYFNGYTHSLRGHLFEANLASLKLAENVERYLKSSPA